MTTSRPQTSSGSKALTAFRLDSVAGGARGGSGLSEPGRAEGLVARQGMGQGMASKAQGLVLPDTPSSSPHQILGVSCKGDRCTKQILKIHSGQLSFINSPARAGKDRRVLIPASCVVAVGRLGGGHSGGFVLEGSLPTETILLLSFHDA